MCEGTDHSYLLLSHSSSKRRRIVIKIRSGSGALPANNPVEGNPAPLNDGMRVGPSAGRRASVSAARTAQLPSNLQRTIDVPNSRRNGSRAAGEQENLQQRINR